MKKALIFVVALGLVAGCASMSAKDKQAISEIAETVVVVDTIVNTTK